MSDNDRKGFFARLFGGRKSAADADAPAAPPDHAAELAEESLRERAAEPAADMDGATAAERVASDRDAHLSAAPEPAGPEEVAASATDVVAPEPAGSVGAEAPPAPEAAPQPVDDAAPAPEIPAVAADSIPPQARDEASANLKVEAPSGARQAPEPVAAAEPMAAPVKQSWWQRLKGGLARTSSSIGTGITDLFVRRKLDAAALEDLEDLLIQADLGVETTDRIIKAISTGRHDKEISAEEVKQILADEVESVLTPVAQPLVIDSDRKPFVMLMIGVNGAGKTTTIGKLAQKMRAEGRSVMLAAGDTFRAAAIEQLKVWGERTGAEVIARPQGSDAAGLAFDALKEARERGVDVLMIDTAGRLQNKAGLMAELEKIVRVVKKFDPEAPHAALLVLDATTGQNAVNQVEIFSKTAGVTGLVMTKLDGTARGGILVSIAAKSGLPVHYIGVGEGVDDLEPFAARDFARAIAGLPDA